MTGLPWEILILSVLAGVGGGALLVFGWRWPEIAPVLIYCGVGAAVGGWLFDAGGLQPIVGATLGGVLGGMAGAYLHTVLAALTIGTASAALLAVGYWVVWMRRALTAEMIGSATGWRVVQTTLSAHPTDAVLCSLLPAVGMLGGLLLSLRHPRQAGIVLCSLLGGFAMTFAALLLIGRPATTETLLQTIRPGWLWLAALPLAGVGVFIQFYLAYGSSPTASTSARPTRTARRVTPVA